MRSPYQPDHRIRGLLDRFGVTEDSEITTLADLQREVSAYGKRECDKVASRDNLVYYLGAAFEVNRALDLDSFALTGLLALQLNEFEELAYSNEANPPAKLIDAIRHVLAMPPVLAWARAQGIWMQWKRLEKIYRSEVDDFRKSDAFLDKKWRRKGISPAQHYIIGEIERLTGVSRPVLTNRGEAWEYIAAQGGNPRFLNAPPIPVHWRGT